MISGLALKKPLIDKSFFKRSNEVVKIMPAKSVVRDIRDYRNSIFVFHIKKGKLTSLKDFVRFFTNLFKQDAGLAGDSRYIALEIVAPLEKLKKIEIFDEQQRINLEVDEGESYLLYSPDRCFITASQSVLCEARWAVYNEEKNTSREIFYHRISFVSE